MAARVDVDVRTPASTAPASPAVALASPAPAPPAVECRSPTFEFAPTQHDNTSVDEPSSAGERKSSTDLQPVMSIPSPPHASPTHSPARCLWTRVPYAPWAVCVDLHCEVCTTAVCANQALSPPPPPPLLRHAFAAAPLPHASAPGTPPFGHTQTDAPTSHATASPSATGERLPREPAVLGRGPRNESLPRRTAAPLVTEGGSRRTREREEAP